MERVEKFLKRWKDKVNNALEGYLLTDGKYPPLIYKAIHYSVFAGGKRLRPILLLSAYISSGGKDEDLAMPFACAVELIHTYSLIHDDLPAMDDDDFRRGKPSSHKVFGEGVAILAGDALFSEAFDIISHSDIPPEKSIRALKVLTKAIGPSGVVGGQVMDIKGTGEMISPGLLRYIHSHKTGALISAALEIGVLLADADEEIIKCMKWAGLLMGMSFQITDDILDIMGEKNTLGKSTGKDIQQNKITYPALYGLDGAKYRAEKFGNLAKNVMGRLNIESEDLRNIVDFIIKRAY